MNTQTAARVLALGGLACLAPFYFSQATERVAPGEARPPRRQPRADAERKSAGCVSCHTASDQKTMHASPAVVLGCTDCHGGDAAVSIEGAPGERRYRDAAARAHVAAKNRETWRGSANPVRSYTALLEEDLAFVRFVNPGDLRAAPFACGACHEDEVRNNHKSMMTHGAMLYGAALYDNGVVASKTPAFGESYGADGRARGVNTVPAPTLAELEKGVLASLGPLPRWELSQPGNFFRAFERGGRPRTEIGLPDPFDEPGRPDDKLSARGPGTATRTDPIVLGAQKTRLADPLLSLLGTNDHPGDYRSSGCTACHVVYANDRDPAHSGDYAAAGNRGATQTADPTIPRGESGHPVKHAFTRAIPTSQCITCHVHPGTNMLATYLGYTWWDNEVDGQAMYPRASRSLSSAERDAIERANPEGSALRGLWSDPTFLANVSSLNPQLKHTQFADFHGHGWVFRAVYKQDRKGRLLDARNRLVADDDPKKFEKAVHLEDIHLERGMHCVDCHFQQDVHGNGKLYGEPRAAISVDCVDCHGTRDRRATLTASGPAGEPSLEDGQTPWGQPRFERQGGRVVQHSMLDEKRSWTVPQVADSAAASEKARRAHDAVHANDKMTCYACHSSWTTSCFGCHLSMRANQEKPTLHAEGGASRNWTSYDFQTLRDDIFFLAKDGAATGNRIAPARSSCAVLVSSQNQNREWLYSQQQTVSAAGFAGTAFSTYVPHTVRTTETKTCTECHVAEAGDNNAWIAELLMQGTGFVNFVGRYAYVGEGRDGFQAVAVTEREEPQAVIGSRLHELAYPEAFVAHVARGRALTEAYGHGGRALSLQLRGEYLFVAQGRDGLRIYDVARVDQKGFSERIVSAPVSPLGQRLAVATRDATSVTLPSTMTIDPSRRQLPENLEQKVHPLYDYAFVTDREEGLVVVGPLHTLLDGDPTNNFARRAATYDGGGALRGATSLTLAGTIGYATTPRSLVLLDLDDPLRPRVLYQVAMDSPRAVAIQFRYAFVLDRTGLEVLDVTDVTNLQKPGPPRLVPGAALPIGDARALYVARTYAYVAAGKQGLAIVDVERPEHPKLEQVYDARGAMDDASDVKLGMTNGSAFAYVADGRNGLRVVQIVSANDTPGAYGFSPRPTPQLVATYKTRGPAIALSRGLDRDRAVDETGHQLAVFGRRGARPLTLAEQQRLYLTAAGKPFAVSE